jgi:hypothetical protein
MFRQQVIIGPLSDRIRDMVGHDHGHGPQKHQQDEDPEQNLA